jgi:polyvinyl alcohol dehydrogenase (cytochrome)
MNATDFTPLWKVPISNHRFSLLTQNPGIKDGRVFFGLSSNEEGAIASSGYTGNYTFVGRFYCISLYDGSTYWNNTLIPDEISGSSGYTGASVWSGSPTFWKNHVIVTTGNMYSYPNDVGQCLVNDPTNTSCVDSRVLYDSLIIYNRGSGQLVRTKRFGTADAWNGACLYAKFFKGCPIRPGPDGDFGNMAMVGRPDRNGNTYAALAQKTGMQWIVNLNDLSVTYSKLVGPGSLGGGFEYGGAMTDSGRIVNGNANFGRARFTTLNGTNPTYGTYVGLDLNPPAHVWETPSPSLDLTQGAITATNDIWFGATSTGKLYAGSVTDGAIQWSYNLGYKTLSGPSIDRDCVYIPTGASPSLSPGVPGIMYKFCLPPQ